MYASSAQFTGIVGDILIAQEGPGRLWHVHWDNVEGAFKVEQLAYVGQWEHITFVPIPAPPLQFTVKFICGKSEGEVVAPGAYYTAINVHNPNNEEVRFRKKIAIALPGEKPGPVSRFFEARLGPDQVLEIDCPDIVRHASTPGEEPADFLEGFVVIENDVELDVVVVYTAAGRTGQVETLDVERVYPRHRHPVKVNLPDLVPVPDPRPEVGFCKREGGNLIVTVRNQGTAESGPFSTEVDFFSYGKVSMPTPTLGPGESADLLFPIPLGCFDPDCDFQITVDADNQVIESDEGNNVVRDTCSG
jgi:hypothetical protein